MPGSAENRSSLQLSQVVDLTSGMGLETSDGTEDGNVALMIPSTMSVFNNL